MKLKLFELLKNSDYRLLQGDLDLTVSSIAYYSGNAKEGSVFVCIEGAEADGHDFAETAVQNGAAAVICRRAVRLPEEVAIIQTEHPGKTMAQMAAVFYGNPAEELILIGITGTKGKTTTAYMIQALLNRAGCKTGLIGTIHTDTGAELIENKNTTPESPKLHCFLRKMAESGCRAVVMEVSSQALMRDRCEGLLFDLGVFTNIEKDHIGPQEHKDFAEYAYWKSRLFERCRKAVVNGDDPNLPLILKDCRCPVVTYGFGAENGIVGASLDYVRLPGKLGVEFQIKGDYNNSLVIGMAGKYSCCNAMAAAAVFWEIFPGRKLPEEALRDISVPGRQEMFAAGAEKLAVVDYAHNGQALRSLLTALRAYRPKRLTCLFGCGGQRDPARRAGMAEAAAELSDFIIVTTDNPRKEPPENIIEDIVSVLVKKGSDFAVIPDRAAAVYYGISHCGKGEILAVCGKGHETYQLIGDEKIYFDDRKEVLASIEKVNYENNYTG